MVRIPIDERRRRLIEATIAIIAEAGVCGATTRAIVARADMPLASFHYVFESHQELLLATLHTLIESEMREHRALGLDGDTQAEVMRLALSRQIDDVLGRIADYRSLVELAMHVQHMAGMTELPAQFRQRRIARTKERLEACQQRGVVFEGDLNEIAEHLVTMADGQALGLLSGADPEVLRAALRYK